MKAVVVAQDLNSPGFIIKDLPTLTPNQDEVVIRVCGAGVNRLDLLQAKGIYPTDLSHVLGVEVSGHISQLGPNVSEFNLGEPVIALLPFGGYAEEVKTNKNMALHRPTGLDLLACAGIIETFLTAYYNLFELARLPFLSQPLEKHPLVLIHGGTSGVGTAGLQLCLASGCRVYCTVGSKDRAQEALTQGAEFAHDYNDGPFEQAMLEHSGGQKFDVILDFIGAAYFESHLNLLAPMGKLICIGLKQGHTVTLPLNTLLNKNIQLIGSSLQQMPLIEKTLLIKRFGQQVLPHFSTGLFYPVIDKIFPLEEVQKAHAALKGHHVGKIILQVT